MSLSNLSYSCFVPHKDSPSLVTLKSGKVWLLKCVQRTFDIAGTATEMHLLLFWPVKRPFQIPVAPFDQNRMIVRKRGKPNSLTRDNFK